LAKILEAGNRAPEIYTGGKIRLGATKASSVAAKKIFWVQSRTYQNIL
jgi:hypothetical protein